MEAGKKKEIGISFCVFLAGEGGGLWIEQRAMCARLVMAQMVQNRP